MSKGIVYFILVSFLYGCFPTIVLSESCVPLAGALGNQDNESRLRRFQFIDKANALFREKYAISQRTLDESMRGFGAKNRDTNRDTLEKAAVKIFNAYNRYYFEWQKITMRARDIFERRAWEEALDDGRERLALYGRSLDMLEKELRNLLGVRAINKRAWEDIRARFKQGILGRYDQDLAITYFYSIMRRIFAAANVPVEYDDDGIVDRHALRLKGRIYLVFYRRGQATAADIVRKILQMPAFKTEFANFERDVARISEHLEKELSAHFGHEDFKSISMLKSVFYRNKGAYLIGRLRLKNNEILPFALALVHLAEGITVDAVLMDEESVSGIFSYTRANFHVEVSLPELRISYYREMVEFLKTTMPRKDKADLLSAIGFISPAKIAFTENLRRHLKETGEKFSGTKGEKGTVMITFTLDTLPYVFKIISDKDKQRKQPPREPSEIAAKYDEVHMVDRVGRLLDIMVFTNVRLKKSDFSEETYAEIARWAPNTLIHENGDIIIKNLYVQRKLTPLDIYLEAHKDNPGEIKRVLTDLGNLIKELAFIDKWPGPWDLHIKNVGVTYYGKTVLYDYDELTAFRSLNFVESVPLSYVSYDSYDDPDSSFVSTDYIDRMFYKRISLQDLLFSMNVPYEYWDIFREAHPDLFRLEFYENMKERIKQGDIIDYFPYPERTRIRNAGFGTGINTASEKFQQKSSESISARPALVIAAHFKEMFLTLQTASGRAMFGDPGKIIVLHPDNDQAASFGKKLIKILAQKHTSRFYDVMTGSFELLKREVVVDILKKNGFFYIGDPGALSSNLKATLYPNNTEIATWAVWFGNALWHELKGRQITQTAA